MSLSPRTLLARSLRRAMTEPEWRLWHRLKGGALQGEKFVRQHPIGPYVVDFCCRKAKLVIEVDGWTHGEPEALRRDADRTAYLSGQGYRVIRFHNDEIMRNTDGVLASILAELQP